MKRKAKNSPPVNMHLLSIEEIEEVGRGFKDDLQRKVNRYVRRGATSEALACLESIEHVDQFIYTLKLRAGSLLDTLRRPARARPIHIRKDLVSEKRRK